MSILVVAHGSIERRQFVKQLRLVCPTQEVIPITDAVSLCEALAMSRPTGIMVGSAVRWIATHRLIKLAQVLRPEAQIVVCRPSEDHLDDPGVLCTTEPTAAVERLSPAVRPKTTTRATNRLVELPKPRHVARRGTSAAKPATAKPATAKPATAKPAAVPTPTMTHPAFALVTESEHDIASEEAVQGSIIIASENRSLADLIATYVHRLDCNILIQTAHHMVQLENLQHLGSQPTMLLCSDKLPGLTPGRLTQLFQAKPFHLKVLWAGKNRDTNDIVTMFDHKRNRPIQGVTLAEDVQMWLASWQDAGVAKPGPTN
jgi:hypothetical protein